jgi:excisionase family DNA binding protein
MTADFVTMQPDELLDTRKLSEYLKVPEKSIRNWQSGGRLPYVKIGRLVRYRRIEIEKRLLNGQLLTTRE